MTVYVAEIDGRAVVAFNADNDLEAELEVEDEIFQNDLARIIHDCGIFRRRM